MQNSISYIRTSSVFITGNQGEEALKETPS